MKVQCTKEEILEGLQMVQSVVSAKTTMPMLANVLLQAGGDTLEMTTTDLEVGMRKTVSAKVVKAGEITLPAKRLFAILRELPVTDVVLETSSNNQAVIKYGASFFRVLGLPTDDFPRLPKFKKSGSLSIDQKLLKAMIKKTSYAISHDESRYVLNGLYIIISKGRITGVATDGRRLALCEIPVKTAQEQDRGVILPTKAVQELSRFLGDEGEVTLSLGENQVEFGTGDCTLVTRLVEGHFPNYNQVIPSRSTVSFTLDREEFLSATRRVSLVTSEQSNSIKLSFQKNRLVINSNTPDVGEAREELTIAYAGDEITIAFNPDFLIDVLKNLDEPEVSLELIDSLNPGVVRCGKSFTYVIMPIRLS